MATTFQKEFTVSSYEVNPSGKARLTTMANYFQEIAYQHANELGFGYRDMKERHTMWLLSRMRIRMERYPAWDERVVLETWPSGVEKLFAARDFRVSAPSGEQLGVASSYWLIVDLNTHRPVKPREELERYANILFGKPVFSDGIEKIIPAGSQKPLNSHTVSWSDLDVIGHANNVKYMEWALDAVRNGSNPGKESWKQVLEFRIQFMKETRMGDEVVIHGGECDGESGDIVLSGVRSSDDSMVFLARMAR